MIGLYQSGLFRIEKAWLVIDRITCTIGLPVTVIFFLHSISAITVLGMVCDPHMLIVYVIILLFNSKLSLFAKVSNSILWERCLTWVGYINIRWSPCIYVFTHACRYNLLILLFPVRVNLAVHKVYLLVNIF